MDDTSVSTGARRVCTRGAWPRMCCHVHPSRRRPAHCPLTNCHRTGSLQCHTQHAATATAQVSCSATPDAPHCSCSPNFMRFPPNQCMAGNMDHARQRMEHQVRAQQSAAQRRQPGACMCVRANPQPAPHAPQKHAAPNGSAGAAARCNPCRICACSCCCIRARACVPSGACAGQHVLRHHVVPL